MSPPRPAARRGVPRRRLCGRIQLGHEIQHGEQDADPMSASSQGSALNFRGTWKRFHAPKLIKSKVSASKSSPQGISPSLAPDLHFGAGWAPSHCQRSSRG